MTRHIVRLVDFTKFPGSRYKKDGPGSGEEFREKYLVPALHSSANIIIDLEGVMGFSSSFIEEAFGGLVRENKYSGQQLYSSLSFQGSKLDIHEVWESIKEADKNDSVK